MNLIQDLRFGLRVLFKNPGFMLISVLTLALGIGANTAIFSIVYGMMLKPMEYESPGDLYYLYGANPAEGWTTSNVSLPNYLDWKAQSNSFENMGLYTTVSYTLSGRGGDRPQRIRAVRCTASLLPTLGVEPVQGQTFGADTETFGRDQVALLFDSFWKRRFNADPEVVGRTLTLDQKEFTIIGVLPPAMEKAWGRDDVWCPLVLDLEKWTRGSGNFEIMARLREGVSHDEAQAELINIAKVLEQEYPEENLGLTVNVVSLSEEVLGEEGQMALYTLMAAVFFVLLIACSNMANLLLARGNVRQKEVAIRTALGASKMRIVLQMVTECLILSLLGGVIGTMFAFWGVDAIVAVMPDDVPRKDEIRLDNTVLLFTLGLSVFSPLLFGLIPALMISNFNLVQTIKESGRSSSDGISKHRGRDVLVIGQIAMALALVVSAGLMIRSFSKLRQVDPGFDTNNLLTLRTSLPEYNYVSLEQRTLFYERVCTDISQVPGVESVSAVSTLPLAGSNSWSNVTIEGHDNPDPDREIHFGRMVVTPEYFKTMRIPMLAGREFTWQDNAQNQLVVIVNRRIAETYWPDEEPLGKRFMWGETDDDEKPWMTVIGVSDDVRHRGLDRDSRVEAYVPHAQADRRTMTFVMRTESDPMTVAASVQDAIWRVDPDQAIYRLMTMADIIYQDIGAWDIFKNLLSALASIALFLAAVGLYGLMAYNISKRTKEIGIRMALGAQSPDVLRLVLQKSLLLTLIGIFVGLGLAYGLGKLMQGIMYEVTAADPMTYVAVMVLLFGVALLATYLPARRALRIDPMEALRYE
ncbi:MAG: ABC transporter permease [Planctomycetota bacterium]|nr:ABC transporter permease [Planctomycetota bacterium]